jgi:hypothetical protein
MFPAIPARRHKEPTHHHVDQTDHTINQVVVITVDHKIQTILEDHGQQATGNDLFVAVDHFRVVPHDQ